MNGLLFLLCCVEILGALLCGANTDFTTSQNPATTGQEDHSNAYSLTPQNATLSPTTGSQITNSHNTSPSPGSQPTTTSATTSTTTTTTTTRPINIYRKECLTVFMAAGGLIIACTILLITTLLLMLRVCQLSNHVKMLSNNADLISTTEYWMGTAKKSKSASETEAKETTVLMADISQMQEDVGNGAAKEEAVKVKDDGQTGEKDKKEVGDTAKSEEASTTPVTAVENASSSKPQEEAADSKSIKAGAAPSSKGTEEPKEV